jgi:tRNA pseudouridine55 synthase
MLVLRSLCSTDLNTRATFMIKSPPQSENIRKQGPQSPETEDGVLVIDKPEGLTSHDVVARVRKILRTRRVGHAGTLDPFATGALVVCVNRATRLVQFLTGDDKEYVATMRLGFATDTGDLTGTPKTPVTDAGHITSNKIQETFSRFLGPVKQIPPMYSAKKIGGVKLYEMARSRNRTRASRRGNQKT